MRKFWILLAVVPTMLLVFWGCTPPSVERKPVRVEMEIGDRQQEWALIYFQSWRQHRDDQYLMLSRRHMATAIQIWFGLQVRIGHSFPDFYVIDARRRQGCQLLDEIDRQASKFGVSLGNSGTSGCFQAG